jgi:hypothetical protein
VLFRGANGTCAHEFIIDIRWAVCLPACMPVGVACLSACLPGGVRRWNTMLCLSSHIMRSCRAARLPIAAQRLIQTDTCVLLFPPPLHSFSPLPPPFQAHHRLHRHRG